LFGISFLLAFGFQYAPEACLGGLNVLLLYGVRPLLEAMENLDCIRPLYIQNSIPRFIVLFAQFINARAYLTDRFPVGRNLPELQSI